MQDDALSKPFYSSEDTSGMIMDNVLAFDIVQLQVEAFSVYLIHNSHLKLSRWLIWKDIGLIGPTTEEMFSQCFILWHSCL